MDASQEMLAVGLCNIFGSFFQSMPVNASFSRGAVSNASGIRTSMGGIYAGKKMKSCLVGVGGAEIRLPCRKA